MKTFEEIATEYAEYFVESTRNDSTPFIHLSDTAPEDLKTLVQEIHGDMLPDDCKYAFISDAFDGFSDDEDYQVEADVYTTDLTKWLHSHNMRVYYVTEAMQNFEPEDGFALLSSAQYCEKDEVAQAVRYFIESKIEELEDGE